MKYSLHVYFQLFLCFCLAQSKSIQVVCQKDSIPLENVLFYNKKSKEFSYSNGNGLIGIESDNANDSIQIRMPSYQKYETNIKNLGDKIYLKPKVTKLEEVVLKTYNLENTRILKTHIKNEHKTSFISSGGAILSSLNLRSKYLNDSLRAFQLKLEGLKSEQKGKTFVRPLLVKLDEKSKKWDFLLKTPKTIQLKPGMNELRFNLNHLKIKFQDKYTYLFGFELIGTRDRKDHIKVYGGKRKGSKLFIRSDPNADWEKIDELNYSLSLKLYLKAR